MEPGKPPFVLVPGAWAGGWSWRPIVAPLRAAGHDVYPITLTGLGERSHLLGPGVDLDVHVTDVVNTIVFEDLRDVVLVGHSYAGMVITGVAAQVPGSIRHLVYLDSVVPEAGETFRDCLPPELAKRNAERSIGHQLPIPEGPPEAPDEATAAWMQAKHRAHPAGTMTQPLAQGRPAGVPCTYVRCTESYATVPMARHFERARAAGFTLHELPTIHHCQLSMPEALIDILTKAAAAG